MITFKVAETEKPYTRHRVLSTVNNLFDPLGFAALVSRESTYSGTLPQRPVIGMLLFQKRSTGNGSCGETH